MPRREKGGFMSYRIFICDDEPQILQHLAASVKEILSGSEIFVFADGESLQGALGCGSREPCGLRERREGFTGYPGSSPRPPCDILLLDIDMPGLSGLDIAGNLSRMEKRPLLAFVTSHDELVYNSLQFHPFGFVRKGCLDSELTGLLTDCAKELSGRERHFRFHSAGVSVKLPLCDILYFEAEGNYLKLFVPDGNSTGAAQYRFRETLSAVEAELSGSGFVRVHKGYLVNQAAVRALGADGVRLVNGACIPIGRSYAETARKRLMRYMIG